MTRKFQCCTDVVYKERSLLISHHSPKDRLSKMIKTATPLSLATYLAILALALTPIIKGSVVWNIGMPYSNFCLELSHSKTWPAGRPIAKEIEETNPKWDWREQHWSTYDETGHSYSQPVTLRSIFRGPTRPLRRWHTGLLSRNFK